MSFLAKVLAASFFFAFAFGQTTSAPYNGVTANHYVGLFSGALFFPYATSFCQPAALYGSTYIKYTCIDSNTMKYEAFSDSICTSRTVTANVIKNSSISAGSYGYFQCSGSDGYYTTISLAAEFSNTSSAKTEGCKTANQVTLAVALNACAPSSTSGVSFSVYCDSSHAELQYFASAYCSARLGYLLTVSASTTCDYLFSNNATGIRVYVFGELSSCELSGTTSTSTTTTTTTTSATTTSTSESTTSTSLTTTTSPPYNNVTANHFVGLFNGALYFPYATSFCQPTALFGGSYVKYTCIDSNTIKYESFSDSSCTSRSTNINITKNSSIVSGSYGYFQCSGSDGYYAKVSIAAELTNTSSAKIDGCMTANQVTIGAALGVCAPTSDSRVAFSVYCDSSHAELQYFASAYCSARFGYQFAVNAYTTCDYLFTNTATGSPVYIYGELTACENSGTTSTSTTTTTTTTTTSTTTTLKASSAPLHFTILSLILNILAYVTFA